MDQLLYNICTWTYKDLPVVQNLISVEEHSEQHKTALTLAMFEHYPVNDK